MRNLVIVFGLLFSSFLFSQSKDDKPKSIFNVEINGAKTVVKEGEDFKLDGKTIKISLSSEVTFSKGNIRFNYPQYFTYEYKNLSESLENWVLSGNHFKIFLMKFKGNQSIKSYVQVIRERFVNSVDSEIDISLNKNIFKGYKIDVSVLSNPMKMEIFKIKYDGNNTYFLVFQDTKKGNYSESEEYVMAKNIIDKTLVIE